MYCKRKMHIHALGWTFHVSQKKKTWHNLGTFCCGELLKLPIVWISVAKIWSRSRSLILLFPQENHTFGISGINLWHLGAELSILRCRKRFRGRWSLNKFKNNKNVWCKFGEIFGCQFGDILYSLHRKRCEKHAIERPGLNASGR
jgi:hypothetical protein